MSLARGRGRVCAKRPRLGRDRYGDQRDAGEAGEGGLGADAASVRPGDDQLGGDDWSHARLVEQCWRERVHVSEDLAFELVSFGGRRPDAAGEAAEREPGRKLVGAC